MMNIECPFCSGMKFYKSRNEFIFCINCGAEFSVDAYFMDMDEWEEGGREGGENKDLSGL